MPAYCKRCLRDFQGDCSNLSPVLSNFRSVSTCPLTASQIDPVSRSTRNIHASKFSFELSYNFPKDDVQKHLILTLDQRGMVAKIKI